MKQYKTRPGVVLTAIGELNVLVAAKSIRDLCPAAMEINETAAFCWRILELGADLESLTAKISDEYEIDDPAVLRQDLVELLEQLKKANYLIEEP